MEQEKNNFHHLSQITECCLLAVEGYVHATVNLTLNL